MREAAPSRNPTELAELRQVWSDDLPVLNQLARAAGVNLITLGADEERDR